MRLVLNSLHDEVAAKLRERIFAGELAPGSFIDEPALCSEWSISRTPLREALKVLTAEGLLRHEPRRGCFVSEITERDLDEIFPVIALLEGRCAFEAANNATDADLAAFPLWIAVPNTTPGANTFNLGPWPRWALQQYSWTGQVPGIVGDVDERSISTWIFFEWGENASRRPVTRSSKRAPRHTIRSQRFIAILAS